MKTVIDWTDFFIGFAMLIGSIVFVTYINQWKDTSIIMGNGMAATGIILGIYFICKSLG